MKQFINGSAKAVSKKTKLHFSKNKEKEEVQPNF
jgi:hypothetical protein